jgi:hypothetical protein
MLHAVTDEGKRRNHGHSPRAIAGSGVRTVRRSPLAALQSTVGNQAMLRFLNSSRPGATDGAAPGVLQRKCACGGAGSDCADCKKKEESGLQRSPAAGARAASGVPPIVHDVLRTPGQPLDREARAFFEPRFGHDFSKVRVHTDARAADSAEAVDALAYTVGTQIVFGSGRFRPDAPGGRQLLAHELTHVTQQNESVSFPLRLSSASDYAERQAERSSSEILGGNVSRSVGTVTGLLQRQENNTPAAPGGPGAGGASPAPPGHGVGSSLCAAHPDERYYKTNPGYCQDTSASGSMHAGFRCYREIPIGGGCPAGKHVCFDPATGKCDPDQSHIDATAPSISRTPTGMCDLTWWGLCSIDHFFADVIPALLAEGAEVQVQCIQNCRQAKPSWMQGLCMQGCTGGGGF